MIICCRFVNTDTSDFCGGTDNSGLNYIQVTASTTDACTYAWNGGILGNTVIIKKYNNRRLYNTETSKYITLAEVAEMIRKNQDVAVADAKTGEDVTAYILTQIVLDDAKNNNTLMPVPLLHTLIRYGDNVLREFFDKHLNNTIENYIRHKSDFDDHFKRMLELGNEFTNITRKTMGELSPMKSFMDIFGTESGKDDDSKDNTDQD